MKTKSSLSGLYSDGAADTTTGKADGAAGDEEGFTPASRKK